MPKPCNSLNDPARASRSDYLRQDGKTDTSYRYQTAAQSTGAVSRKQVPENVKHILSNLNFKKK